MSRGLRAAIIALALGFAGWVGVGIYRAGGDVPPPPPQPQTKLTAGHAEGRRIDGKPSWSLDYDRLTATPDSTLATLENVRNGELYNHGKPFMRMIAKHVVVNTLSNDFTVNGPIELIENDGKHQRRLTSVDAVYSGPLQMLTLNHPAKITSDGIRADVATVSVDFASGAMRLGKLSGIY